MSHPRLRAQSISSISAADLDARATAALAARIPLAEWALGTLTMPDGATALVVYIGGTVPGGAGAVIGHAFLVNLLSAQRLSADLEAVLNTEVAVRGLIRESLVRSVKRGEAVADMPPLDTMPAAAQDPGCPCMVCRNARLRAEVKP